MDEFVYTTLSAKKARRWIGGLAVGLVVLFLGSFVWGRYDVSLKNVIGILLNELLTSFSTDLALPISWTDQMEIAVLNIRLPRIMLACLVGCCLATAGTAYQSVFQNPMAAPDILGASSGACFGAALAILLEFNHHGITVLAFVCSLLTIGLVYLIGQKSRGNRVTGILLAGVMVSSLFSAGTSYIKLVADPSNQLPEITYWMLGSLSGIRMSDVTLALIPMLFGVIPLLLLRWRINLLTIGEDEARTMGVNTGRLRLVVILSATVLTAASVAVSGMIGWVGLVIPHLSRKLVGNDCRYLLPTSMLFGAGFLLFVDNISRNLLATEIPIGILTAFIGAPFFIYLMTRKESVL